MTKMGKEIKSHIRKVSTDVLQVDNLYELWEEGEYSLQEILSFDYIVECDTGYLFKVKK